MTELVRSADDLIVPDLAETLQYLPHLTNADRAAVKLARRYSAAIDGADPKDRDQVLATFGPRLLAVLEQLGATPKARAAGKGGVAGGGGKLAALRAARPA